MKTSTASVLLGLSMMGCPSDPKLDLEYPNVMIVTFDTLRADHTSLCSADLTTTPNLVRLARQGIEFTQAYSPSSTTGPAHASLFTGLYPAWHSVIRNGITLDDRHKTLAEWFSDKGYRTAAFVSSYVLNHTFGFAQGFDAYSDDFSLEASTLVLDEWNDVPLDEAFDRRANATTDAALEWLSTRRDDSQPFFLFTHYFDPHAPYTPPREIADRFEIDLDRSPDLSDNIRRYDAEIAFADEQLGRLLDLLEAIGKSGSTLVVVTADHGEGLMDHGLMEHGALIYEPLVRIPLVIRLPDRQRATESRASRIDVPVSLVDLYPTIQSLVAMPTGTTRLPRTNGQGRDLSCSLLDPRAPLKNAPIFFHRRPYSEEQIDEVFVDGERFAVRDRQWKLFSAGDGREAELYDLDSDPGETTNQIHEVASIIPDLEDVLEQWISEFPDRDPVSIPPQVRQSLEALGYAE